MTSKGEQLFYVVSLFCVITGFLGAATYIFYFVNGGSLTGQEHLTNRTIVLGVISYLLFRSLPGYFGWRGCKKRNPKYVSYALGLSVIALVLTLGVQRMLPGVGTGWLVAGFYTVISFRYLRALTAEQRAEETRFTQKPEDGPRLR